MRKSSLRVFVLLLLLHLLLDKCSSSRSSRQQQLSFPSLLLSTRCGTGSRERQRWITSVGSGTVPLVAVCVLFAAAARSGQRDEEQHADKLHFEIKWISLRTFTGWLFSWERRVSLFAPLLKAPSLRQQRNRLIQCKLTAASNQRKIRKYRSN